MLNNHTSLPPHFHSSHPQHQSFPLLRTPRHPPTTKWQTRLNPPEAPFPSQASRTKAQPSTPRKPKTQRHRTYRISRTHHSKYRKPRRLLLVRHSTRLRNSHTPLHPHYRNLQFSKMNNLKLKLNKTHPPLKRQSIKEKLK